MIDFADPADLAYIILVAWLGGCALLAALTVLPITRGRLEGVWPLMLSEAVILLAGTVPWLLPRPFLGAALTAAAIRIGYESGSTLSRPSRPKAGVAGATLLAGLTLFTWFVDFTANDANRGAWAVVLVALAFAAALQPSKNWLGWFLIFPALPFILFVHAASWLEAASVLMLALFIVEIFDSFSLLGGRLFGRRPLVPKLSPRKTWEGLAAGFIAVVSAASVLSLILDIDALTVAAIAIASTIGAIAGDLTASAAKRRAHVKDYPSVIASQGGLLDIYDSWIVAGPLSAGAVLLLKYLG